MFIASVEHNSTEQPGGLLVSEDGQNWSMGWIPDGHIWNGDGHDVTYADGTWIAVNVHQIYRSTDGINWTKVKDHPDSDTFFIVEKFGSVWYAGGMSGRRWRSLDDGMTWLLTMANFGRQWHIYSYDDGVTLYGHTDASHGGIDVSTDQGETWSFITPSILGIEYASIRYFIFLGKLGSKWYARPQLQDEFGSVIDSPCLYSASAVEGPYTPITGFEFGTKHRPWHGAQLDDGTIIIVGDTDPGIGDNYERAAIWRSTDDGGTFHQIDLSTVIPSHFQYNEEYLHYVLPSGGKVVVSGEASGYDESWNWSGRHGVILYSDDYGATFSLALHRPGREVYGMGVSFLEIEERIDGRLRSKKLAFDFI